MIYFKYVRMVLRSFAQYKLSALLTIIGQFFVAFFATIAMFLLFERFENIAGWTMPEVMLCYAVVTIAFAITECFARGFDRFSNMIREGSFDRVMLRPRSTVLQVLGSSFEITRIGRLVQSVIVLWLAVSWLPAWDSAKIITLVLMILSGIFIFAGVFILGAVVCFWTVEGLEFINIFTDGGREIASYPLPIYPKWIMRFFTFIIPFGSFNYLPLMYLTGRVAGNAVLYMFSPLLGVVFIIPCLLVWRFGVSKYLSTGS